MIGRTCLEVKGLNNMSLEKNKGERAIRCELQVDILDY